MDKTFGTVKLYKIVIFERLNITCLPLIIFADRYGTIKGQERRKRKKRNVYLLVFCCGDNLLCWNFGFSLLESDKNNSSRAFGLGLLLLGFGLDFAVGFGLNPAHALSWILEVYVVSLNKKKLIILSSMYQLIIWKSLQILHINPFKCRFRTFPLKQCCGFRIRNFNCDAMRIRICVRVLRGHGNMSVKIRVYH